MLDTITEMMLRSMKMEKRCRNGTSLLRLIAGAGLKVFLCVCTLQFLTVEVEADNFTIGYLYSDKSKGFIKNKQGRIISGAMTYAVNVINHNPNLLPGHTLKFIIADTYADTLHGTKMLTEQWKAGAVAFIGPEDSCDVEARVAAAWNLPMLSYVSCEFFVFSQTTRFERVNARQ